MLLKLRVFAEQGVQVESWLKGELLALCAILMRMGIVEAFEREVRVDGGKIDLRIRLEGRWHWVELKHWLVGEQVGTFYSCCGYFGDADTGVKWDVEKLRRMPPTDGAWLLLLMTANPGQEDWAAGIAKFNERFGMRIETANETVGFPEEYFLGLARVSRGS
jgi:hypothetical protein